MHRGVLDRGRRLYVGLATTSILAVLLLLVPTLATADGMAFRYGPASSLKPLEVNEQRATIAHKDGMQRMLIAINLGDPSFAKDASRAAVWIFPVPGSPDRADVDVTDFVPQLNGNDVEQAVKDAIFVVPLIPLATQPHFFPFALALGAMGGHRGLMLGRAEGRPGVTTHKAVDRWGIHAELVTAESAENLGDYLRAKKVEVGGEQLSTFAPYLSNKYALVVAWISSYEELVKKFPQYGEKRGTEWASLYVEFPTDRPFYPMRPTSGYGEKRIEVTLYVVGWLKPDTSSWAQSEKRNMSPFVRYYAGEKEGIRSDYRALPSTRQKDGEASTEKSTKRGQGKPVERFLEAVPEGEAHFTRIRINTSAENFTQDLWLSPNLGVRLFHFVTSSQWAVAAVAIFLLVAFSYISGGISGKLVFGTWRPWARIGLWNCLTIVALVIATWLARRGPKAEGKATTASRRWEALFFGGLTAAVLVPMSLIITSALFETRWPSGSVFLLLLFGLIPLPLLITTWLVSQPRSVLLKSGDRDLENQRTAILRTILRSFIYVLLVCAPSVLFIVAYGLFNVVLVRPGHGSLLIVVGLIILVLSGLITLVLFIVLWIARKIGSLWRAGNEPDLELAGSVIQGRRSVTMVLGVLTCILGIVLVVSITLSEAMGTWRFFIGLLGLFTLELLVATWILWKGTLPPYSPEVEVSPTGPFGLAVLLAAGAPCVLIVRIAAQLSGLDHLNLGNRFLSIPYPSLFGIVVVAGLIAVAALISRRCIRAIALEMEYGTALSTIFVILSILLYLALFTYMVFFMGIAWRVEVMIGSILSIWALFLATRLIKGELNEKPTKALRFGVLFSVVFTVLNLGTFVGLKALVASVFS